VTAWDQVVALLLVCGVFGWTDGKQLVGASYADGKIRTAEMKAERKRKKAEKRRAKLASKEAKDRDDQPHVRGHVGPVLQPEQFNPAFRV
jgi:hypothetical protein